jgi:hypothetical protein
MFDDPYFYANSCFLLGFDVDSRKKNSELVHLIGLNLDFSIAR